MEKWSSRINNKTVYTFLLLVCIMVFWFFENFYTPATYTPPDGEGTTTGIPGYFIPGSTTGALVKHNHFWLSYNEPFEQAEWVAYSLEKRHLTSDNRDPPLFIEDPLVKTRSADWRNYRGSRYDRGHLCPAGDRRFSRHAYNETFYTSNIAPQNKEFNAGVWYRLELQVCDWCQHYGTLHVVTGGVLQDGLPTIGVEGVAVPKAYYKIVARGTRGNMKVLAFLIPHRESAASLKDFLVPVDEVERLTVIDFFEDLPAEWEDKIENSVATTGWKF